MSSKRYYWLKLNEGFFEEDTILFLEEQENGKDYVIFYLKLLLKSLKEEGTLVRYIGERLMPYDTTSLSKLTNTPVDTVRVAMQLFIEFGLVKQMDAGELYLTQIDEMIGSETDNARRVRKHRAQKNANRLPNEKVELLQCNTEVTSSNIEIEKELEQEKELKKNNTLVEEETEKIPYKEIIDYLNEKTGKGFKTAEGNKKYIRYRWNEGYRVEDFKKVIDNKVATWKGKEWRDTKNRLVKGDTFLRPSTLFANKFDEYLNEEGSNNEENTFRRNPIL